MISRGTCVVRAEAFYAAACTHQMRGERQLALVAQLAGDMYRAAGLRQYVGDAAKGAPDDPSRPSTEEPV